MKLNQISESVTKVWLYNSVLPRKARIHRIWIEERMMEMKKNTSITNWTQGIKQMGEERKEINNKLSPNKSDIRNALAYAKEIYETVVLISNTSDFAHEDIISFDVAQKILESQNINIQESIKHLEIYLGL